MSPVRSMCDFFEDSRHSQTDVLDKLPDTFHPQCRPVTETWETICL